MKSLYGRGATATASSPEPTSAATVGSLKSHPEWDAPALRPVAHWVKLPDGRGGCSLSMVWEVPDPLPSSAR